MATKIKRTGTNIVRHTDKEERQKHTEEKTKTHTLTNTTTKLKHTGQNPLRHTGRERKTKGHRRKIHKHTHAQAHTPITSQS